MEPNSRRPTVRDVAAHAGVGIKTVSRVINDESHVSDGLRARVKASIRALGYRPNPAAQGLRRSMSRSIALVLQDVSEPFQSKLAAAVEEAVGDASTVIVASARGNQRRERELIESFLARQIDGLILVPTETDKGYLARERGRTAVVCVDRPVPGMEADLVMSDNRAGMESGLTVLARRGHSRIALLGDQADLFTQRERLTGYQTGLTRNGLAFDSSLVYQGVPDSGRISQQLAYFKNMPSPPTALVTTNSLVTFAVFRAANWKWDFDIVAFDDFPLADVINGGITVVAQDAYAIGTEASNVLLRRVHNDDAPIRKVSIATQIIDRSGASPATKSLL